MNSYLTGILQPGIATSCRVPWDLATSLHPGATGQLSSQQHTTSDVAGQFLDHVPIPPSHRRILTSDILHLDDSELLFACQVFVLESPMMTMTMLSNDNVRTGN